MEGCSVVVGDGGEGLSSEFELSSHDECWEEATLRDEPMLATERRRIKPTPPREPGRDMMQLNAAEALLNVQDRCGKGGKT
jgi:hypothetical protein